MKSAIVLFNAPFLVPAQGLNSAGAKKEIHVLVNACILAGNVLQMVVIKEMD